MPFQLVRTSTLPEELGRIGYLLSDKTGTLTQNEMHFKKLHIGRALFAEDGLSQLHQIVHYHCCSTVGAPADATVLAIQGEDPVASQGAHLRPSVGGPERRNRRTEVEKVAFEAIKALSICHNVTPVYEEGQVGSFPAIFAPNLLLLSFMFAFSSVVVMVFFWQSSIVMCCWASCFFAPYHISVIFVPHIRFP